LAGARDTGSVTSSNEKLRDDAHAALDALRFTPLAHRERVEPREPFDLLVRLFQIEAGGEIAIGGRLDHLRERLRDLLLRIIDVLQLMQEHVF
jgi:hypothetical protein